MEENLRTPWHVLLDITLESVFGAQETVQSELQLTREPDRIDVLLSHRPEAASEAPPLLPSISRRRGERTVIEFKGPTDRLGAGDFLKLYTDALLYVRLKEPYLEPGQLHLMTLADQVTAPYRRQAERYGGRFEREEPGIWRVDGLHHVLYCLETGILGLQASEYLLYPFSRHFLKKPTQVLTSLQGRERTLFQRIWQQVLLSQGSWNMEAMKDVEEFSNIEEEIMEGLVELVKLFPAEKRLRLVKPEEVLKDLSPEERLKDLSPEERLKGLSPEQLEALKHLLETR